MPRPRRRKPRARVNLDIAVNVKKEFDTLQSMLDADSMTETFRRAIRISQQVVSCYKRGGKVILRRGGEDKEIVIL